MRLWWWGSPHLSITEATTAEAMPKFCFCLKYWERARHTTINHRGEETPHSTLVLSSISQRSYAQLFIEDDSTKFAGARRGNRPPRWTCERRRSICGQLDNIPSSAFVDNAAAFNDAFVEDVTTLTCVKDKAFVDEVATLAFAEQVPKTLGIWTALVSPGEHQRLTGSSTQGMDLLWSTHLTISTCGRKSKEIAKSDTKIQMESLYNAKITSEWKE